jgi:hypothetical protein
LGDMRAKTEVAHIWTGARGTRPRRTAFIIRSTVPCRSLVAMMPHEWPPCEEVHIEAVGDVLVGLPSDLISCHPAGDNTVSVVCEERRTRVYNVTDV